MSSQLERPTRLYSAADRQTECWSRSCWSIDHTEVYASGATKTIHKYAIRLSHDRAVQYMRGVGTSFFSFAQCLSFKKEKNGQKGKEDCYPTIRGFNQSINFGDTQHQVAGSRFEGGSF